MKRKFYILRIFNKDGSLKVTYLKDDYQNILQLTEIYYSRGFSYAIEVVQ